MAIERKRKKPQKSESLTIRLDPKMRFALEFVARIKGQTITKVIERAVIEAADRANIDDDNGYDKLNWHSYWDVNEGVRTIHLAQDSRTHPSFEEEEMLDFIKFHWRYFSYDRLLRSLDREKIEVLWPHMSEIMDLWRETKSTQRNSASWLMNNILADAGIKQKEKSESPEDSIGDEIPF